MMLIVRARVPESLLPVRSDYWGNPFYRLLSLSINTILTLILIAVYMNEQETKKRKNQTNAQKQCKETEKRMYLNKAKREDPIGIIACVFVKS